MPAEGRLEPEESLRVLNIELRLGGIIVPVASLADVRRMKERAARPKDRIDLGELDALGDADGEG